MQGIHRLCRFALLLSAMLLLLSCSMDQILRRGPEMQRQAGNSAKHSACIFCHRYSDPCDPGAPQPFAENTDPSNFCLDCHHYETDHHPVDIVPDSEIANRIPAAFPLSEGRIRCTTCHQAHDDPGRKQLHEPYKLLRGGPYNDVREQCSRCHDQWRYRGMNPHRMLNPDNTVRGIGGQPVCLVCHLEQPDQTKDSADVRFRAGVSFLCWRCHASMIGTFMGRHFEAKPKRATMESLRQSEMLQNVDLPLSRDRRLTCSTCHNPHQAGVIRRAAAGAGADAIRRLRLPKEELCSACHRI